MINPWTLFWLGEGWHYQPFGFNWSGVSENWTGNKTGSKLGKEYVKAAYCHPSYYLTYMQSSSREMPGWMKNKLESRLPGEISITSDSGKDCLPMQEMQDQVRTRWSSLIWIAIPPFYFWPHHAACSFPNQDGTHAPCSGSMKFWNHWTSREVLLLLSPPLVYFYNVVQILGAEEWE